MWTEQIDELSGDYRVLAPDMPGFGRSGRPMEAPPLDDWAGQLLDACTSAGVERAVVGGCSMGGYLAFAMLRRAPHFVAGLALIDTRAGIDSQDVRRARYEMVEKARHEGTGFLAKADPPVSPATHARRPDVVAAARAMTADATAVGVMVWQRALAARKDAHDLLALIDVPTCVVQGADDPIVPRAEAEEMARGIRAARFVLVPDAGHLPPIEQPAAVTEALRDVLRRSYPA
jgi:pimeloyl-ACP methyl ester carboxylesterase